jgi:hypothetical protein
LFPASSISDVLNYQTSQSYQIWNRAIGRIAAAIFDKSIFRVAQAMFPKLRGSNYNGAVVDLEPPADLNGHPFLVHNVVGTASAPECYGFIGQVSTAFVIDPRDPRFLKRGDPNFGGALKREAWTSFLLDQQKARACRRGGPRRPLQPWIASRTYEGESWGWVGYPLDPRYYFENLYHLALLGTETFVWWNPVSKTKGLGDMLAREIDVAVSEINHRCGGPVQTKITTETLAYTTKVVLTGAVLSGGKRLWRASFAPEVTAYRCRPDQGWQNIASRDRGIWLESTTDRMPDIEVTSEPGVRSGG